MSDVMTKKDLEAIHKHSPQDYSKEMDDYKIHEEIENDIYDPFSTMNRKRKSKEKESPKFRDPLYYTAKEFLEFKERLGILIQEDGISQDECAERPDVKQFIENYTYKHFIKDKQDNILSRYTYKCSLFTLGKYSKALGTRYEIVYPIVQQFKGHFLVKAIYFAKSGLGVTIKEVTVKNTPIILT